MNRDRRESLRNASDMLRTVKQVVDKALGQEQDALDSVPENLESSERYEKMENAVDALSDASEELDEALEHIMEAIQ